MFYYVLAILIFIVLEMVAMKILMVLLPCERFYYLQVIIFKFSSVSLCFKLCKMILFVALHGWQEKSLT